MDVPAPDPTRDCPECGTPGWVHAGVCDLCFADLDEHSPLGPRSLEVAGPIRFSDVVAELREVAELALDGGDGPVVAAAAERAQRLLGSLRAQFHRDLGLPLVGSRGATPGLE